MKNDDPITNGSHRELFEESVAGLDAATANRLRLMRRASLATRPPSRTHRLVPVAAFAMGLLALGLGWRMHGADAPPSTRAATAETGLEFDLASEEDAALYAWLGEAPVAAENESL